MRLLHTADWHLGRTLEGRSRLEEQQAILDEIIQMIEEENIDAVLMAGDVFDSVNPPAAAEEMFYEAMARMSNNGRVPVIVIAGNHDHPERLAASRTLLQKHGIHLRGYPGIDPVIVPVSEERLYVQTLPYPSESRLKQAFMQEATEIDLRDAYNQKVQEIFQRLAASRRPEDTLVGMSHLFIAGSDASDSERPIEVGGAYTVTADSLPEHAVYTALGHMHRPQDVRGAGGPARYSGSPLAYSFSEAGQQKSVTIIDTNESQKEVHISTIPLTAGKPLSIWKARNGLAELQQWVEEQRDWNAWVEVDVYVENQLSIEDIHALRTKHTGLLTIRPVYSRQELEPVESKKHIPIDQLFERFYEKQSGGAVPDPSVTNLFLELIQQEDG